jgi:hypothetical protein
MAPRSKPRASKKKVGSRSAAEMVLREEILGRVFDWLEIENITQSIATCKQFDAALPRVTRLFTSLEGFQRVEGLIVLKRLSNLEHVELDVFDSDLLGFFTNAVHMGKQWTSIRVRIFRTNYLLHDEDEQNLEDLKDDFAGFASALKRGYLPKLDYFELIFGPSLTVRDEEPSLADALDAVYRALPARAAVAAAIGDGAVDLIRRVLDENDLDINAADSSGHTPLSLWCRNKRDISEDSMASMFNELVSRGADVNQLRGDVSLCCMAAISPCRAETKLRLLLAAGASLTVGCLSPLPLLCQCYYGSETNAGAVDLLLKHDCDVTGTFGGKTAMEFLTAHLEVVQDHIKLGRTSEYEKKKLVRLQSMLISLGHAAQKHLKAARAQIDSLQAEKRAAGEPKTATRAKKKSRK